MTFHNTSDEEKMPRFYREEDQVTEKWELEWHDFATVALEARTKRSNTFKILMKNYF